MTNRATTTHYVPCYIFMQRSYDWSKPAGRQELWKPAIYSFKPEDSASCIFIKEQLVSTDIPENWSPVMGQIAALDKLAKHTAEEYLKKIEQITQEKNKLLALTLSPTSGEVE